MANSVDITYKGSKILSAAETGSATLKTAGKYMEGDVEVEYTLEEGGSVTVEPLNVDEGGTYTAPTGKAYSPVNVPYGSVSFPQLTKEQVDDNTVRVAGTITANKGFMPNGSLTRDTTVQASEVTSGTKNISTNGTHDVTNYKSVQVNVESGGGAGFSDVNFYDYDGTIVQSYSASDFASLSAMPDNPTHSGLTAQGWNWSLSDAKAYVAKYGKLNIGQMYITTDGKTRIYIRLKESRLAPYLGIAINGTATVEWGDGTTNTVTGTSTSTVVNTQHTYSSAGDYTITISVSGSMALVGYSSYGSQVLWKNSTTGNLNRAYQNAIQKVEIGSNTSIGNYAFYYCQSLTSVTIPNGITSIGKSVVAYCYSLNSVTIPSGITSIGDLTFNSCYSLNSVTIPSGITSIGTDTFSNCRALASVTIPSGITSIGDHTFYLCHSLDSVTIPSGITSIDAYALHSCFGLGFIKFTCTTPPTVSNSNAWMNIPTDCIIYVPSGRLTAYKSATNYPSSSKYTYVEY